MVSLFWPPFRHVALGPHTGWGLVAKVDQAEILGPTRQHLINASIISLIGVLSAALIAALIAGRIARPIKELSLVAHEVEAGNLNARVAVVSRDEVGNLAATFNSMIERVRNWHQHLEQEVASRTLQLTELNEGLTREIAERRRAEERIQEQHRFLESVIESLAHPFYVIDVNDYRILMANSAATLDRLSGGSTCYALTHGRTSPCQRRRSSMPRGDSPVDRATRSCLSTLIMMSMAITLTLKFARYPSLARKEPSPG